MPSAARSVGALPAAILGSAALGLGMLLAGPVAGGGAGPVAGSGAGTVLWQEHFAGSTLDWVDPEQKYSAAQLARLYSVAHNNGFSFLHARHDMTAPSPARSMHYGKAWPDRPIPLDRIRALKWRWRALVHPPVTDDPWLDMAASIYVIMRPPAFLRGARGFKFGWAAKPAPAGTHQIGLLQIELRHDPASPEWRAESVDLCALYRKEYGPCEDVFVRYVGVTTDADGTKSVAEGDYADFEIVAD
jgi:hypothetical protein